MTWTPPIVKLAVGTPTEWEWLISTTRLMDYGKVLSPDGTLEPWKSKSGRLVVRRCPACKGKCAHVGSLCGPCYRKSKNFTAREGGKS